MLLVMEDAIIEMESAVLSPFQQFIRKHNLKFYIENVHQGIDGGMYHCILTLYMVVVKPKFRNLLILLQNFGRSLWSLLSCDFDVQKR